MLMLHDFLIKRIEEEEAVVEKMDPAESLPHQPRAAYLPRWDKARLENDCTSRRVILASFNSYLGEQHLDQAGGHELAAWRVLQNIVKAMAMPYDGHPDYQVRWRVKLI
jgi:hypothetical protein